MVRLPRGSYIVLPLLSLEMAISEIIVNSLKPSSTCKSASQAVVVMVQLSLHETRRIPHSASHLVQAMSAWSVKSRHAPSRHSRDARV